MTAIVSLKKKTRWNSLTEFQLLPHWKRQNPVRRPSDNELSSHLHQNKETGTRAYQRYLLNASIYLCRLFFFSVRLVTALSKFTFRTRSKVENSVSVLVFPSERVRRPHAYKYILIQQLDDKQQWSPERIIQQIKREREKCDSFLFFTHWRFSVNNRWRHSTEDERLRSVESSHWHCLQ